MRGGAVDLAAAVRAIPDHPTPGVLFYDLMPLFADPRALDAAVVRMAEWSRPRGADLVLGAESRGFILGGALARELGIGFVAARKPGKLPFETVRQDYSLEYGEDGLEMHIDAIRPGQRVLIHDDLLATGGTAAAKARLVELLGGIVAGFVFIVELTFLPGRERLAPGEVHSLVTFDTDRVAA